jgi:uncharacterized membrane protein YgdD (TMEM256/DUF423 family)
MTRVFFVLGSLSACLAVALGAFAAHGLRERVSAELLAAFETGARYHMYHALALIAVAWATARGSGAAATAAGWLFVVGTVLFCGSLYLLALTGGPPLTASRRAAARASFRPVGVVYRVAPRPRPAPAECAVFADGVRLFLAMRADVAGSLPARSPAPAVS